MLSNRLNSYLFCHSGLTLDDRSITGARDSTQTLRFVIEAVKDTIFQKGIGDVDIL